MISITKIFEAVGKFIEKCWNKLLNFISDALKIAMQTIENVKGATTSYSKRDNNQYVSIANVYNQDNLGDWHETKYTRKVVEQDITEIIRKKLEYVEEIDVTNELEYHL